MQSDLELVKLLPGRFPIEGSYESFLQIEPRGILSTGYRYKAVFVEKRLLEILCFVQGKLDEIYYQDPFQIVVKRAWIPKNYYNRIKAKVGGFLFGLIHIQEVAERQEISILSTLDHFTGRGVDISIIHSGRKYPIKAKNRFVKSWQLSQKGWEKSVKVIQPALDILDQAGLIISWEYREATGGHFNLDRSNN